MRPVFPGCGCGSGCVAGPLFLLAVVALLTIAMASTSVTATPMDTLVDHAAAAAPATGAVAAAAVVPARAVTAAAAVNAPSLSSPPVQSQSTKSKPKAKAKSKKPNPQLTIAAALMGSDFYATERSWSKTARRRKLSPAQKRRRRDARRKGKKYRKPSARRRRRAGARASLHTHDWTERMRVETKQPKQTAAATPPMKVQRGPAGPKRAPRSPTIHSGGSPSSASRHLRRRTVTPSGSEGDDAADRATQALHSMAEQERQRRLAKKSAAAAAAPPPTAPSAFIPAEVVSSKDDLNRLIPSRAVLRAAGMDPRAPLGMTRSGLPLPAPKRAIAPSPFDLDQYGVEDILAPETATRAQSDLRVDETVRDALDAIRKIGEGTHEQTGKDKAALRQRSTLKAKAQSTSVAAAAAAPPAAKPAAASTLSDAAERRTNAGQTSLLDTGSRQLIRDRRPAAAGTDVSASVPSALQRLQQAKELVRSMQHARRARARADRPEQAPTHATEDSALQFMPSWKRLLFLKD